MIIKEIQEKQRWESFLDGFHSKTFLQSWNWGKFCSLMGQKIWRLGVFENNDLICSSLIVKVEAKRGSFLMIEHGPNFKNQTFQNSRSKLSFLDKLDILDFLIKELKKLGKKERAGFIRICPILDNNKENKNIFRRLGFRDAPIHVHPEIEWILDINQSEENIFSQMRKTTRYLIRQALNNPEIKIIKSTDVKDLKLFFEIYKKTALRQKFTPFSFDYLKNELEAFKDSEEIMIFLGKHKGKIISGAMIIYWQKFGFYHQGASFPSKIPVNYLLQWEAIKEAKKRGCFHYSFWGIAPDDKPNHPWAGLTLFKKGFGGRREEYLKTQDLILSNKYWINYFIETLRRRKRHL